MMKPLVCIYNEGSDTKAAVFEREKGSIKILRTFAVANSMETVDVDLTEKAMNDVALDEITEDINFEDPMNDTPSVMAQPSNIDQISAFLSDFNLSQTKFIPIATEPSINYSRFESHDTKDKKKLINKLISQVAESKDLLVKSDSVDCINLENGTYIGAYLEGEVPSVEIINALAKSKGRRYLKIHSIKSAELTLGYLVSKTTKFFPEDYSLVIYTGREFSKLIFLEGQNIKHIGTSLDIGTENLHTYDVYFSKILLEMENGGIPRLDNVILCGDDTSENLILSFYGTFPEANVTELKFDEFDLSKLSIEEQETLSSFSIPIAAALEYYDELDKKYKGINILPNYIKENQKVFQFGWHTLVMLPLIFGATFFFTVVGMNKSREIDEMSREIIKLEQMQIKNQALLDQISYYDNKVTNFDKTQAILDSASAGSEVWTKIISKTAYFMERRRNFWLNSIEVKEGQVQFQGYSLSRSVLTRFADYNNSSLLENINYEPMRKMNAFAFSLKFALSGKKEK